ncbi:MAG: SCO family protein [Anaerolineae bacterium]|nr:SCO family protein [Anaerolineae bacterium]
MAPKNKYFFLLISLLLGLTGVGVGCQVFGYEYKGSVIDPPLPLPNFELMAANGQPFRLSEVEGDLALLYFGYTYCPDVCPLTLSEVKKALTSLENGRERVHVIFISVDPERDTPAVLSKYMAAFGPEFTGLTDDFERVQAVMQPYGAYAEKQAVPDSALGYLVNHTARLYLVDPQRNLILTYPFGFTAADLRSDLAYLLRQESRQ